MMTDLLIIVIGFLIVCFLISIAVIKDKEKQILNLKQDIEKTDIVKSLKEKLQRTQEEFNLYKNFYETHIKKDEFNYLKEHRYKEKIYFEDKPKTLQEQYNELLNKYEQALFEIKRYKDKDDPIQKELLKTFFTDTMYWQKRVFNILKEFNEYKKTHNVNCERLDNFEKFIVDNNIKELKLTLNKDIADKMIILKIIKESDFIKIKKILL